MSKVLVSSAPIKGYVVWCDVNNRNRSGIAPCAYAFMLPDISGDQVFWGRGGERNSQVMLAHAIVHIANVVASSKSHSARVELVVRNIGTDLYFEEHIWKWLEENTAEELARIKRIGVWKNGLVHLGLGRMFFSKSSKQDKPVFAQLLKIARDHVNTALMCQENKTEGVKHTNDGPYREEEVALG